VGDDEYEDEGMAGNDRHITLRPTTMSRSRKFASLGLFIIDEFAFTDAAGKPTGLSLSPQERAFPIYPRSSPLIRLIFVAQLQLPDWRRRHLCYHRRSRVVRVSHCPRRVDMPAYGLF
jgi:hypothetical protein